MLSMAELTVHRRVRISFFRFPFVHLTHITSRFLIAFCLFRRRPESTLHYHLRYALASTRIRHQCRLFQHPALIPASRTAPTQLSRVFWRNAFQGRARIPPLTPDPHYTTPHQEAVDERGRLIRPEL